MAKNTTEVTEDNSFETIRKTYEDKIKALQTENEKLLKLNDTLQAQLQNKVEEKATGRPTITIEGKQYLCFAQKFEVAGKKYDINNIDEDFITIVKSMIEKGTQLFVEKN